MATPIVPSNEATAALVENPRREKSLFFFIIEESELNQKWLHSRRQEKLSQNRKTLSGECLRARTTRRSARDALKAESRN
jgi:hypothetical protein